MATRFEKGSLLLLCAVSCLAVPAKTAAAGECEAAQKAGQVLLTIKSDADCKLTINDKPEGVLAAGKERAVRAPKGKQVVRCASVAAPGAVARDERRMDEGCDSMDFEVAQVWRRFTAQKGAVTDSESGLSWMQSDNGGDVDWSGAEKYCKSKGGRLPSDKELKQLHTGDALSTPCGEFPCFTSHLFRLSGRFFWTSTKFEGDQAIVVGMAGVRPAVQSVKLTTAKDARALCLAAGN